MNIFKHIFFFTLLAFGYFAKAQNIKALESVTIELFDTITTIQKQNEDSVTKNIASAATAIRCVGNSVRPKKKWIAALLALPLPFGVVGLHRIYLGTKPHIPLVYVATIGGVFGLLPLADFIAILSSTPEELQNYQTGKVFFWLNK